MFFYISEVEVLFLIFVGQLFVIDVQQVEYCSLKIVDMYWVFSDVVIKVICFFVYDIGFNVVICYLYGKVVGVVVVFVVGIGECVLRVIGVAKFIVLDDEGIIQYVLLFEVYYECS